MAARYWVGGSGTWDTTSTANWSATSGGAGGASAPTSADDVFFNAASGLVIVTLGENVSALKLSMTGFTGTLDFQTNKISLHGNAATIYTGATTSTIAGTPVIDCVYAGSTGTRTLNAQTVTESNTVSFNIPSGSDSFNFTGSIKNIDFTGFAGTYLVGTTTRRVFGNFKLPSGLTVTAGTAILVFAATSGVKTIETGGNVIDGSISFDGIGGTFAFQDALTQGSTRAFTITNGTVRLKNGVTSTVGAFATSGTNQKFLESTVAGSQATLSQASGTVNASNLTIKDINATGGATWNSLWSNNNIDAGNNAGWVFGDPPITLATEYTYALRSFTQPRRF